MRKILKKIMIFIMGLVFVALVLNILPKPQFERENPWLAQDGKPLVMAHAGGKGVYPDNTMKAFQYSYDLGVDVLEMDLQMTEDRVLVLRHGENQTGNIRSKSNCDTVIWKETYQYLYDNCNFAYNYDVDGTYPYRDLTHVEWVAEQVYLTTLEEVFDAFGDSVLYNIEIKADADAWRTETADELYDMIVEYELEDHVLVATSFQDISEYIAEHYPELYLSTSQAKAQDMVIKTYSLTNILFQPDQYSALQIPMSYQFSFIEQLNLSNRYLIWNAHRHNMAIHYWTINDEDEMRLLIENGCDGIITDYPELLMDILNEE